MTMKESAMITEINESNYEESKSSGEEDDDLPLSDIDSIGSDLEGSEDQENGS